MTQIATAAGGHLQCNGKANVASGVPIRQADGSMDLAPAYVCLDHAISIAVYKWTQAVIAADRARAATKRIITLDG